MRPALHFRNNIQEHHLGTVYVYFRYQTQTVEQVSVDRHRPQGSCTKMVDLSTAMVEKWSKNGLSTVKVYVYCRDRQSVSMIWPPLLKRLGAHFSTVISPSWITEQISVGKCAHRVESVRRERQTSFKIVTRTKQTWTKHHNTPKGNLTNSNVNTAT